MSIQWSGLSYRYAGGSGLLSFPDFSMAAGQHLLLRGPSGSGKSTLLALMAGLLTPTEGRIDMAGSDLGSLSARQRDAWRGAQLGFVPQRLHLSASLNVLDNLALPFISAGLPPRPERAQALLQHLGLADLGQRLPHQLSVGQAQRVALARALMRQPALLLADEPSASLDDRHARQVLDLLLDTAAEQGITLILATHDSRLVQPLQGRLDWRVLDLSASTASEAVA
ncbi:ATP-binding cassette domain-containing protein [Paucibacter sp. DJ1R-11]|uniref:ABC transporter ATP-binding protein n=1 Tax=unclassified Roseateles TaxID=2626991 RepID=UPI0021E403AD|nr:MULTISPECIES: ATP-binding cassette domain-containing protein [unclassified Roseateles]MCV2365998.1 ATP-binding cassette domain-containing protein [Paucibacter sp. DJ1R-11]MCV2422972.1 ATP-binding cassette domain-containing protein [Paucibacter sp. DJ4R-1]MCV2440868.1 ATP-binding cassette domain-containing protein [Paucibacter sp. DJ2R-2]